MRTITGVATSITAFIGRALKGPVDEPTTIFNYGDYERHFGGLWTESTMSYAVKDFYLNRGSQAIIVRVVHDDADTARIEIPTIVTSPPAIVTSPPDDILNLDASSPGAWGNNLYAEVDNETGDPTEAPTSPPAELDPQIFNLTITEKVDGEEKQSEKFLNVTLIPTDRRYLPRVLEQSSTLVTVPKDGEDWDVPIAPPQVTISEIQATGGDDGGPIETNDYLESESDKTGLYALEKADLFNLLCIPPAIRTEDTDPSVYQEAMAYCTTRRAMLIVDPPFNWGASPANAASNAFSGLSTLGLSGKDARNAALYFPRVRQPDPERDGQPDTFVPCGIIAGVMSSTDTNRGVWKAPAGLDAALNGIQGLQVNLTDDENGRLNQIGINCLRVFPINGRVVWGARTLRGADQLADEYKYVPVRRTALFIEESLYRGTQWVVFEPNDEPLWAQIRLNVGAFMHNLFRQGAFQGTAPKDAYLVKCDKETTTQNDINLGIVNILVGFAPLKPAEFVIIKIQQLAGQIEV
nr:phage tail sheath C-terminal domain-containing protein [Candidatus Scalindua japonica]